MGFSERPNSPLKEESNLNPKVTIQQYQPNKPILALFLPPFQTPTASNITTGEGGEGKKGCQSAGLQPVVGEDRSSSSVNDVGSFAYYRGPEHF